MKWGRSVILHLPEVLLRDHRDVEQAIEVYTVDTPAGPRDVHFRWTEQQPPAGSGLRYSEDDEAHLFAILPVDVFSQAAVEEIVGRARQIFDEAASTARKAD